MTMTMGKFLMITTMTRLGKVGKFLVRGHRHNFAQSSFLTLLQNLDRIYVLAYDAYQDDEELWHHRQKYKIPHPITYKQNRKTSLQASKLHWSEITTNLLTVAKNCGTIFKIMTMEFRFDINLEPSPHSLKLMVGLCQCQKVKVI